MVTEIQDDYAEVIYGVIYNKLNGIEKHRVDTIISRKAIEQLEEGKRC